MHRELKPALFKLLSYCRGENWAGHDPYDALNSALFTRFKFLDSRIPRLALTQALKRSPVNIRGLVQVPKTQNPKGLALFLSALLQIKPADLEGRDELIDSLIGRIGDLHSQHEHYYCWGYSFPWQTRTVLVPRFAPNVVCTVFVAGALLDAYEQRGNPQCLKMAVSAAEYVLHDLYWTEGEAVGFCYPTPDSRSQTHNANLLAAALLCRAAKYGDEKEFVAPALRAARYAVSKQQADGSWHYGETAKAHWIDNFHTGYNLEALRSIDQELDSDEFQSAILRGFEFYRANFFREDGAPKYFHNQAYPLDIHCVAQSILTLTAFKDLDPSNLEMANSVFDWAMKNMWDKRGFFYYRVLRLCKVRTSYMRWSQAWMLLALTELLAASEDTVSAASVGRATVLA